MAAVSQAQSVRGDGIERITERGQLKQLSNKVVAYSAPLLTEDPFHFNEFVSSIAYSYRPNGIAFAWIRPETHATKPVLDGKIKATKYKMYPLLTRILPPDLSYAVNLDEDKLKQHPVSMRLATEEELSAIKEAVLRKTADFNAPSLWGFKEDLLPPGFNKTHEKPQCPPKKAASKEVKDEPPSQVCPEATPVDAESESRS
jgi:hypothetical protein